MGIENDSDVGVNISGIVYDRGLFTSTKWVAGTNAGGIYLGDPIRMTMSLRESLENSRLGQAINRARVSRQTTQKP